MREGTPLASRVGLNARRGLGLPVSSRWAVTRAGGDAVGLEPADAVKTGHCSELRSDVLVVPVVASDERSGSACLGPEPYCKDRFSWRAS